MHSPVLVGLVLVVLAVASLCDLTFKIILVLEVVYLAYFALQLTPRLQRSLYEPPSISNPARLLLWQRCLNSVPSVLEFTESWFRFTADDDDDDDGDDDTRVRGGGGHHKSEGLGRAKVSYQEILRENVREWVAWGLWGAEKPDDVPGKELELLVNELERACREEVKEKEQQQQQRRKSHKDKQQFAPQGGGGEGKNTEISSLRFTYEPVKGLWKPFCLYIAMEMLWGIGALVLVCLGFQYSSEGEVAYWVRRGQHQGTKEGGGGGGGGGGGYDSNNISTPHDPIILLHGIGLGVLPYVNTIWKLLKTEHWSRTLIAIESPEFPRLGISSLMSEPAIYAETVRRIMQKNGGYQKAIFMGHSIGSVYLTWIINNKPQLLRCCGISCTHGHLMGLVTERLVVRDPNVDFRLRRHFTWYQNVLWLSDIPHHVNTYIILSENDTFVPSQRVMEYIVDCQKRGEICKQQRLENYDENIREEDRNQQQHKEDDEGIVGGNMVVASCPQQQTGSFATKLQAWCLEQEIEHLTDSSPKKNRTRRWGRL
eukprot:jgi/Bigna1/90197/estExt_fgenesh1_pg.C_650012